MKRYISLIVASCAAIGHAYVNIDDFTSGAMDLTISTGSQLRLVSGSMVGGDRYVRGDVFGNPYHRNLNINIGSGYLSADSGSGMTAYTSLGWGYKANPNDNLGVLADNLNLNLIGNDRFCIKTSFNDQNVSMRLFVLSDGVGRLSADHLVAASGTTPQSLDFMFDEFSGINFSSVDQVVLHIYGTPGSDTVISNVYATGPVPEPCSLILLGSGLALVAKRRFDRRPN